MSVLLVEKSGGLATLTLNRPEALNALACDLRVASTRAGIQDRGRRQQR